MHYANLRATAAFCLINIDFCAENNNLVQQELIFYLTDASLQISLFLENRARESFMI